MVEQIYRREIEDALPSSASLVRVVQEIEAAIQQFCREKNLRVKSKYRSRGRPPKQDQRQFAIRAVEIYERATALQIRRRTKSTKPNITQQLAGIQPLYKE